MKKGIVGFFIAGLVLMFLPVVGLFGMVIVAAEPAVTLSGSTGTSFIDYKDGSFSIDNHHMEYKCGLGDVGSLPECELPPYPFREAPRSKSAEVAVRFALASMNRKDLVYTWAGRGSASGGFDCSGMTAAAWAKAGVSFTAWTHAQKLLPAVDCRNISPGDLVLTNNFEHVIMYIGDGFTAEFPDFNRLGEIHSIKGRKGVVRCVRPGV